MKSLGPVVGVFLAILAIYLHGRAQAAAYGDHVKFQGLLYQFTQSAPEVADLESGATSFYAFLDERREQYHDVVIGTRMGAKEFLTWAKKTGVSVHNVSDLKNALNRYYDYEHVKRPRELQFKQPSWVPRRGLASEAQLNSDILFPGPGAKY